MDLSKIINKELKFDRSWLHISINSLLTGSLLAYIIIFLDPYDTQNYQTTYRYVKLGGYALWIILPTVIFHRLNLFFYNRGGKRWHIKDELISVALLILAILTCSYFYNVWIVNEAYNRPSLSGFYSFSIYFGLPVLSLVIPLFLSIKHTHIIHKVLLSWKSKRQYVELSSELSSESIKLNIYHFLYAKAEGNYVEIYYQKNNNWEKKLIRATLYSVNEQIPNSIQVHRSFLINSEKVLRLEGNSRKRKVILKGVTDPIPVSHTYIENLNNSENSSPIF